VNLLSCDAIPYNQETERARVSERDQMGFRHGLSKRLDWNPSVNPLAQLLEQKLRAGAAVLDLTESNPTRAGLDYPGAEILASLTNPRALVYEPAPLGLLAAREAVSGYYAGRGLSAPAERILLTASTSEAYAFVFKLLMDPGDRILVPRPCYPLVDFLAALESVEVDSYPLLYDGVWSIDMAALRQTIGPRTRCILIVNPNNPTGSYLKRGELLRLIEICQARRLALIVDEVFSDFAVGEDPERVSSLIGMDSTLMFVLSGLSKVVGLPQMKLAWIWVGGPEADRKEALHGLEHLGDTFLSVSTPIQQAAADWLALLPRIQGAITERLAANHGWLAAQISRSGSCELLKLEGGWYAVLRVPNIRSAADWALELLRRDNVHVHPGYLFDFPSEAYLVVSLLTRIDVLRAGMGRLLARIMNS
jgi:aspartate/methionine/tyrosine aminotransferase